MLIWPPCFNVSKTQSITGTVLVAIWRWVTHGQAPLQPGFACGVSLFRGCSMQNDTASPC